MVQLINTVSPASRNDASPRSSSHLQRATQFLTRVKEIFPDDGSKEESFSHFGQLMLPFHGAIMRELSWIEKAAKSPELVPSSGGIPPWVTSGVKREVRGGSFFIFIFVSPYVNLPFRFFWGE